MNTQQIRHLHRQVEILGRNLEVLTNQFEAIKDIVDLEESKLEPIENEKQF